jgi:3-oxoacyl-[acyl-carrier protein] reductase
MVGRFEGRVAVVTGAGGSLGSAEAAVLAEGGASVIVQDIDETSCLETVRAIEDKGGKAQPLVSDMAEIAAFRNAVAGFERDLGGVDILVNNHGIGGSDLLLEQVDEANYDRLFAVNVKAVFFATQAVVPSMKRKRYGKIINISSMGAIRGSPANGQYNGGKMALIGFARSWAQELAPYNICVNTVVPSLTVPTEPGAPGTMATKVWTEDMIDSVRQQIPLRKTATPEDVANLVAFLVSPEADYITGQAISPNGGIHAGAI